MITGCCRRRMWRSSVLLAVCGALCCTTGQARSSSKARHVLKIATVAPEQSIWMKVYRELARDVLEETDGQVRFKSYPGGVYGDEKTVLRKMRIGQLHGAGFMGTGLSMICPDSQALQLPALFPDQRAADAVFAKMAPLLKAQCEKNGYIVLGWPRLGFSYLFSRPRVTGLATLRRAKPWQIQDDPITQRLFKEGHILAVPAHVGDVLTGLQSGIIQSVVSPPVGMISLQWYSRTRYRLELKLAYSFGAFVLSRRSWSNIPRPLQEKILRAADHHFTILNRQVEEQNREALAVMAKRGIETVAPSAAEVGEFVRLSERVADGLKGELYSAEVLRLVRRHLAAYNSRAGGAE